MSNAFCMGRIKSDESMPLTMNYFTRSKMAAMLKFHIKGYHEHKYKFLKKCVFLHQETTKSLYIVLYALNYHNKYVYSLNIPTTSISNYISYI